MGMLGIRMVGQGSLFHALHRGDTARAIQLLRDKRIDINYQNPLTGLNALMVAAENNYIGIVKSLIAKNVGLNAQSRDGFTALMFAAQNGNREIVRMLLAAGAHIDMQNNGGLTALRLANNGAIFLDLLEKGASLIGFSVLQQQGLLRYFIRQQKIKLARHVYRSLIAMGAQTGLDPQQEEQLFAHAA